jgi:coenzyme F420-reducing hydrogenase alpha subunit
LKILKLPKGKLDLSASVVQQFGELHAPVEQDARAYDLCISCSGHLVHKS